MCSTPQRWGELPSLNTWMQSKYEKRWGQDWLLEGMHSVRHTSKTCYSFLAVLILDLILMGFQGGFIPGRASLTFIQAHRCIRQGRRAGTSYLTFHCSSWEEGALGFPTLLVWAKKRWNRGHWEPLENKGTLSSPPPASWSLSLSLPSSGGLYEMPTCRVTSPAGKNHVDQHDLEPYSLWASTFVLNRHIWQRTFAWRTRSHGQPRCFTTSGTCRAGCELSSIPPTSHPVRGDFFSSCTDEDTPVAYDTRAESYCFGISSLKELIMQIKMLATCRE